MTHNNDTPNGCVRHIDTAAMSNSVGGNFNKVEDAADQLSNSASKNC